MREIESSRSADVAGVSPVPVQTWAGEWWRHVCVCVCEGGGGACLLLAASDSGRPSVSVSVSAHVESSPLKMEGVLSPCPTRPISLPSASGVRFQWIVSYGIGRPGCVGWKL